VAKGVADYLIGHYPGMPCLGESKESFVAASGVVHGLHAAIIAEYVTSCGPCS
jgi:hypothetical protein